MKQRVQEALGGLLARASSALERPLFAEHDGFAIGGVCRTAIEFRRIETILAKSFSGFGINGRVWRIEYAHIGNAAFGSNDSFQRNGTVDAGAGRA